LTHPVSDNDIIEIRNENGKMQYFRLSLSGRMTNSIPPSYSEGYELVRCMKPNDPIQQKPGKLPRRLITVERFDTLQAPKGETISIAKHLADWGFLLDQLGITEK